MSESLKRKMAALIAGVGIMGSGLSQKKESVPSSPGVISSQQKEAETFHQTVSTFTQTVEMGEDQSVEDEESDVETQQEEKFSGVKDILLQYFPNIIEKGSDVLLSELYKTLQPGEEFFYYDTEGSLVVSRFISAPTQIAPVDTENILKVKIEGLEDGTVEYTLESGVIIPALHENASIPLFSIQEENPTHESLRQSIETHVDIQNLYRSMERSFQPEQNSSIESTIARLQSFIQYCDVIKPDGQPYVLLDTQAREYLESKLANYREVLHSAQKRN